MLTVYILKGLPASGKTTWARKKLDEVGKGNIVRVNKDDLRAMMCNEYTKGNEKIVVGLRNNMISHALTNGKHVIVDDTNLNPVHEQDIRKWVKGFSEGTKKSVRVAVIEFDKPVAQCIKDDAKRDKPVGEKVIREMYGRWMKKDVVSKHPEYAVQDAPLEPAFIVDLDGTLALMNGRSPFDASKCGEDSVNTPVLELLLAVRRDALPIFVSGREALHEQATRSWLNEVAGLFDYDYRLFMRDIGDFRKDSIVKREIYEKHIKDKFNIKFVLDDRDQVVDMWRKELKLPCFQVWYGDF